jgi:ribosomal protein S18 acetylase RimI-like enzyme
MSQVHFLLPREERRAQSLSRRVWSHEATVEMGREVNYPARSIRIFRAYLNDSSVISLGCFSRLRLIGQCFGHVWGEQGWTGPIEVDRRFRGRGVASELLRRTEEEMESRGARVIGLEAAADRSDILEFYEKRGYREVGRTLFYQKQLQSGRKRVPASGPMPSAELMRSCRVDCGAEMRMTVDYKLGIILGDGEKRSGALYLHPLRGVPMSALRIILAQTAEDMREIVGEAEAAAAAVGSGTLFFNARADEVTHEVLTGLGYSAKGVNVTFIKKGEYIPPGRFSVAPWAG